MTNIMFFGNIKREVYSSSSSECSEKESVVETTGREELGKRSICLYQISETAQEDQLGREDHSELHKRVVIIRLPTSQDLPPNKEPLDWFKRMKIAAGAARGLEYLHNEVNPPVIYRNFKPSNILLDEGYHPKLSDFGLAKLGPVDDKTYVSTRIMGTNVYCAPEYAMMGQLTTKCDVFSFGVVPLELITGRKAIDNARSPGERILVAWAAPLLFEDRRKFLKMADPLLQGRYPMRGLYQALAVATMCLHVEAATRPLIADVVTALTYLASQQPDNPDVSSNRGHP